VLTYAFASVEHKLSRNVKKRKAWILDAFGPSFWSIFGDLGGPFCDFWAFWTDPGGPQKIKKICRPTSPIEETSGNPDSPRANTPTFKDSVQKN
jgi:hypothetical protein